MQTIRRSALVEHSTARMFDLVNDIAAYPRRFDWCSAAELIEAGADRRGGAAGPGARAP